MSDVIRFSEKELGAWSDEVAAIIERNADYLTDGERAELSRRMREALERYPSRLAVERFPAAFDTFTDTQRALVMECIERSVRRNWSELRSTATEDRLALEVEILRLKRLLGKAAND